MTMELLRVQGDPPTFPPAALVIHLKRYSRDRRIFDRRELKRVVYCAPGTTQAAEIRKVIAAVKERCHDRAEGAGGGALLRRELSSGAGGALGAADGAADEHGSSRGDLDDDLLPEDDYDLDIPLLAVDDGEEEGWTGDTAPPPPAPPTVQPRRDARQSGDLVFGVSADGRQVNIPGRTGLTPATGPPPGFTARPGAGASGSRGGGAQPPGRELAARGPQQQLPAHPGPLRTPSLHLSEGPPSLPSLGYRRIWLSKARAAAASAAPLPVCCSLPGLAQLRGETPPRPTQTHRRVLTLRPLHIPSLRLRRARRLGSTTSTARFPSGAPSPRLGTASSATWPRPGACRAH